MSEDENRIDLFQRKPSELRKYRAYTYKLAQEYGSVMEFVLKERLQWNDLTPGSSPFDDPGILVAMFFPIRSMFVLSCFNIDWSIEQMTQRSCTMTGLTGSIRQLSILSYGRSSISRMTRMPTISRQLHV